MMYLGNNPVGISSTYEIKYEVEEKDVNFIDYDGTILYSYTTVETQALTSLPMNPSHIGLIAQGWNWTLEQIKTQLTTVGGQVWVGQMYTTTSGATEIDLELNDETYLTPYIYFAINGTVTIDWGDNSQQDTITGNSNSTLIYTQHIYTQIGKYTIKLLTTNGTLTIKKTDTGRAPLLTITSGSSVSQLNNKIYSDRIFYIRIGNNTRFDNYALFGLSNLKAITLPNTLYGLSAQGFASCSRLQCLVVPNTISVLGQFVFNGTSGMKYISLPCSITDFGRDIFPSNRCYNITIPYTIVDIGNNVWQSAQIRDLIFPNSVTIGSGLFYQARIEHIKLPQSLTTIPTSTFEGAGHLVRIDIPPDVTTIGSKAFQNCAGLEKIIIPNKVTTIGSYAFNNCSCITEYHFQSEIPPTLVNINAFNSIRSDAIIYVPQGKLTDYQTAENWSTYADYMREEPV